MLAHLLGLPSHPLVTFAMLLGGGLALYFLVAGGSSLWSFVTHRERTPPDHRPWQPIAWAVLSLAGNAALTTPLHGWLAAGHGRLYYRVAEHGWPWLVASVLLSLALTETLVYWIHRALHTDLLFHRLHRPHHSFRVNTPWVAMAFHPLDSFLQALPHHLCAFLFPVHAGVYLTMVTAVSVWAISIHDQRSVLRLRGVNHTDHHTVHHWESDHNFGQYLTFWDKLCGTWRDPSDIHARIAAHTAQANEATAREAA